MKNSSEHYTYSIEETKGLKVFRVISSSTTKCLGLIQFEEVTGRNGDKIICIPKLGTANGGTELKKLQGLESIESSEEKISGLLYIMFKLFITYIKSESFGDFWIRIENPLLTLHQVYRKLYLELKATGFIDDGVPNNDVVLLKC